MAWLTCKRRRSRPWYLLALVGTIATGLASRSLPEDLQAVVGKYPGDALWSLMVFVGLGALFTRASTLRIGASAFSFSLLIEVLKLYQAPWALDIRRTTLGQLVFGQVFSWQNIVAYAAGVLVGVLFEFAYIKNIDEGHAARSRSLERTFSA